MWRKWQATDIPNDQRSKKRTVWQGSSRWLLVLVVACAVCASCSQFGDLALAPIRVSGSVGESFTTRQTAEEPRSYANQLEASMRADSFIWQPWFVTVDGNLNLAISTDRSGSGGGADSIIASGDTRVSILPFSHYPATISYSHTDSRVDGEFGSLGFTSDRVGARAQAMISSDLRASASASLSTTDQAEHGSSERRQVQLGVSKNFETDSLSLNLVLSDQEFVASGDESDSMQQTGVGSVTYVSYPFEDVTTQSTTTLIFDTDETVSETLERFSLQGISTAQWRPKDKPFTVNAALRTLTENIGRETPEKGSTQSETQLMAGTVGLNYPIMPRLTANAGINARFQSIKTQAGEITGEVPSQSQTSAGGSLVGNLSYVSLSEPVLGFDWRWNAGGGATSTFDNMGGFGEGETANLGHSVARTFETAFLRPIQLGASQGLAVSRTAGSPIAPSLAHNVSLSHSSAAQGVATFLRLSVSDRRSLAGASLEESQMAHLQLNRRETIDFTSSWLANLSIQVSRLKTGDEDADTTASANGSAGYRAGEVFGIRNLRFTSTLTLAALGLEDVLESEEIGARRADMFRSEWTSRLDYRIGRIVASLEGGIFYQSGVLGNLIFFRVRRQFGQAR